MRKIIFLLSITLLFTPLVTAKEKGNIQIYCQPKVKIFINKRFKSKSKEKHKGLLIKNLSYGKYEIKLSSGKKKEVFTIILRDSLVTFYSQEFPFSEFINKSNTDEIKFKGDSNIKKIQPEMTYCIPPNYPEKLKEEGIGGIAWVKVFLDSLGNVNKVLITESTGNKELDSAITTVAFNYKFNPGNYCGMPTTKWAKYSVVFGTHPKDSINSDNMTTKDENSIKQDSVPDDLVSVDIYPVMIKHMYPKYPKLAKQAGIQGTVWIASHINKYGDVIKAQVSKSSGSTSLDKAAIDVAYKYRYRPGILDGKKINIWVSYKVDFKMDR